MNQTGSRSLLIHIRMICLLLLMPVHSGWGQQPTLISRERIVGHKIVYSSDGRLFLSTGRIRPTLFETRSLRKLRSFSGANDGISVPAVFTPDDRYVVTGTQGGMIRVWDVMTGSMQREFPGHAGIILDVDVSRDGRYIVSGGTDHVARLWDFETGQLRREFRETRDGDIAHVMISENNRRIITGGVGNSQGGSGVMRALQLWDVSSSRPIQRFETGSFRQFAWSPDGQQLVIADYRQGVVVWDLPTGRARHRLKWEADWKQPDIKVSSDGRFLLRRSSENESVVELWDTESGTVRRNLTHQKQVNWLGFSQNGQFAMTSYDELDSENWEELQHVHVWHVGSGELHSKVTTQKNTSIIKSLDPSVSPNGKMLMVKGVDSVTVRELPSGQILSKLEEPENGVHDIAVASNGSFALVGGETVLIWNSKGRLRRRIATKGSVNCAVFSNEGRHLITGHQTTYLEGVEENNRQAAAILWDVMTGKVLQRFDNHNAGVESVAISRDSKLAVTGTAKQVRVYDVQQRRILHQLDTRGRHVALSADARRLFTYGSSRDDSSIKVWDVLSGRHLGTLQGSDEDDFGVPQIFPNGKYVAASKTASVIWDVETRKIVSYIGSRPPNDAQMSLSCTAISDDGRLLFRSGIDQQRQSVVSEFWSTDGRLVRRLQNEIGMIYKAEFSTDGKYLLTLDLSLSRAARLWSVATGEQLCQLRTFDERGWSVVTPDGRFDTNDLDRVDQHHWVMPDDPLQPLPIEIFMNSHYEPELLSKVLARKTLSPLGEFRQWNRVQPSVEIVEVVAQREKPDLVDVTVRVSNQTRDIGGKTWSSGMQDIHLLRDGKLVRVKPLNKSYDQVSVKFAGVMLPKTGSDKVSFTAYAFNANQPAIKSETSTPKHYDVDLPVKKGRAYLISIGVDAFDAHQPICFRDLQFAANDADGYVNALQEAFTNSRQFEAVVPIRLTSSHHLSTADAPGDTATKRHIESVLAVLSGRHADPEILTSIPGADRLQIVRPEDTVLITFSTHGFTRGVNPEEYSMGGEVGEFYLVPSDIGNEQGGRVLDRCISSRQLSEWVSRIDAAEMVMIIDACQSAGVTGLDFKPAPLGNRGLGQLAYNKRMRILAASQVTQAAEELRQIGHGLLSGTLLHGLESFEADNEPNDGRITIGEWLRYAEQTVPEIRRQMSAGTFSFASHKRNALLLGSKTAPKFQQPVLFDFSRGTDGMVIRTVEE